MTINEAISKYTTGEFSTEEVNTVLAEAGAGYSFRHAFRRECRFNRISRFSFQDGYPVAGQFPRIRSAEAYPLKGVE